MGFFEKLQATTVDVSLCNISNKKYANLNGVCYKSMANVVLQNKK